MNTIWGATDFRLITGNTGIDYDRNKKDINLNTKRKKGA